MPLIIEHSTENREQDCNLPSAALFYLSTARMPFQVPSYGSAMPRHCRRRQITEARQAGRLILNTSFCYPPYRLRLVFEGQSSSWHMLRNYQ